MNSSVEKFKNRNIAVLCGGKSREREISLRSGKRVFDSITGQGLKAVMMDTDNNFAKRLKEENIDLACIMLHGKYGEDGSIQGLLEMLNIPYTGSGVLASALGINKVASKRVWQALKIPTPRFITLDSRIDINVQCENIKKVFPFPLVVKPSCEGSSIGITILKDGGNFFETIKSAIGSFGDVFIEEFIGGCEVTVGILDINGSLQALPVLQLNSKNDFYDFEAKYTQGMTEFIIPAKLPKAVYEGAQKTAVAAFHALGCKGFARIDMIVDRDGVAFVHDANTIPGMTDLSDLPAQAQAAGISYDELVLRILESAF